MSVSPESDRRQSRASWAGGSADVSAEARRAKAEGATRHTRLDVGESKMADYAAFIRPTTCTGRQARNEDGTMDENVFELQLIELEKTVVEAPPTVSPEHSKIISEPIKDTASNDAVLATLKSEAEKNGLAVRTEREVKETESSKRHRDSVVRRATLSPGRHTGPTYFGGMPATVHEVVEIALYSAGSIAAFAAFVDHALSAIKHWRELRRGRTVRAVVAGKMIEVKDGDDLKKLVTEAVRPKKK